MINCHLRKWFTDPMSHILVPVDFPIGDLPPRLAAELKRPKLNAKSLEDSEG